MGILVRYFDNPHKVHKMIKGQKYRNYEQAVKEIIKVR
jgi:hypothetical protein